MAENNFTLLNITPPGIPPYSARGLTQTLEPIAASSKLERTVNGGLINLSPIQMRKFRSKISCTDQNTPAIGGLWPGMVVTVDCVQELSFLTASPGLQERDAITGSVRIEGDFTFYRPRLTMMVIDFQTSIEEYGRAIPWSFDLEEI
jgi:hypothetical protein